LDDNGELMCCCWC